MKKMKKTAKKRLGHLSQVLIIAIILVAIGMTLFFALRPTAPVGPTKAQLSYLAALAQKAGVAITMPATKAEASKMISSLISQVGPLKPDAPATDAQKNFLIKLGYKGETDDLTKGEASQLIDQLLNKQK